MNATANTQMKSPLDALQERVARQGKDVAMTRVEAQGAAEPETMRAR